MTMQNNHIIIVTCTYDRPGRINLISHLNNHISKLDNLTWIIVEDNDSKNQELSDLISSNQNAIHLYIGPTKDKGNIQRNHAYEYIVQNNLRGIVYNADDDNLYFPEIFDEIRKTKRIGIMPVGNFKLIPGDQIEKPIIKNGKIVDWNSPWRARRYPVDMASFTFNTNILATLDKPYWNFKGLGGETQFLSRICKSADDLEILCDNCTKCYVYHNKLYEVFDYLNEKCINV